MLLYAIKLYDCYHYYILILILLSSLNHQILQCDLSAPPLGLSCNSKECSPLFIEVQQLYKRILSAFEFHPFAYN